MGTLFADEKSENPNGVHQFHHQHDVDAGALFVLKSKGNNDLFILYFFKISYFFCASPFMEHFFEPYIGILILLSFPFCAARF